MSFREFRDDSDVDWEVWEVKPALLERRLLGDRTIDVDRRMTPGRRASVAEDLRFGWLVFESASGKRRLAPVPPDWERLDRSGLIELLAKATVRNHPRLTLSGDDTLTSPPVRSISTRGT